MTQSTKTNDDPAIDPAIELAIDEQSGAATGWLLLTLLSMGCIFAITGLRQFFADPIPNMGVNSIWFLLQVAPLLATLPGLLRAGLSSTFFLCLGSLLYFVHGVMIAFDPKLLPFGIAEIIFALCLCGTSAMVVRNLRELEANQHLL